MTPLRPGIVQVRIIRPTDVPIDLPHACLSTEETQRAAAFRFPEHADRWRRFRSGLRMILAEHLSCSPADVPIVYGEFGKPRLEGDGLHFNLSHEDGMGLLALSPDGPVGVDLEHRKRAGDLSGCATSFCHPDELAALPNSKELRDQELLRIWTMKEALLKARGTGFSIAPEEVSILRPPFTDETGRKLALMQLGHPALADHLAHLCVLQDTESVMILDEPVMAIPASVTEC